MMRKRFGMLLVVAALPLVQGCFPLAVTGAGAAALMATDRRTTGIYIEDENIELKALARLRKDFPDSHVSATSFNRRVLLVGQTPSAETKARIADVVREIPSVKEVVNELDVGQPASLATRGSDALVTSNVKARMVNNPYFSANHVKVVTEEGIVYLMGLVTPKEADAAVDVARSTAGVDRVVKVFEYIE